MHPAAADAVIHAGAALRTEEEKDILVSSSVGYYGAQNALQGKCCRSSASAVSPHISSGCNNEGRVAQCSSKVSMTACASQVTSATLALRCSSKAGMEQS